MTLYRELRELLEGNGNTLSETQMILKERLSLGGKTLMEKLENGRVGESEGGSGVEMTWVYFKGQMVKIVRK